MNAIRRFTPTPEGPRPYEVTLQDEDKFRHRVRIAAAYGPNDAERQAEYGCPGETAIPSRTKLLPLTWDDLKAQGLSEGELREWSGK